MALLLTGLAGRFGYLPLAPEMSWIASDAVLLAFATATLLEIGGYYVPWLDNLLDMLATPAATRADATAQIGPATWRLRSSSRASAC